MTAFDMLIHMDARVTLRQLAGSIVMDEIARLPGKAKMQQVIEASGLSRSTIYNVRDGAEWVTRDTLGALEGALGLPSRFLDLIIDGDVDRIKALPGRTADPVRGLPETLRHDAIQGIRDIKGPRDRRSTDRKAN